MNRQLLPLVAALGLGLVVLGSALVTLQRLFGEERAEARANLDAREASARRYAETLFSERLAAELDRARPRIDRAVSDPLADATGLLWIDARGQRLPRRIAFLRGEATPGEDLYQRIRGLLGETWAGDNPSLESLAGAEADSPWRERCERIALFARALRAEDTERIQTSFREFLSHRLRFRIEVTRELPSTLAVLAFFEAQGRPSHALMRQLLRDGLEISVSERLEGLQPLLLSNRERFSEPDFARLAAELAELSEVVGARSDDFQERAGEAAVEPLVLAAADLPGEPALVGSWYVAPYPSGVLYGVQVALDEVLAGIETHMSERELLVPGDRIGIHSPSPDLAGPGPATPERPLASSGASTGNSAGTSSGAQRSEVPGAGPDAMPSAIPSPVPSAMANSIRRLRDVSLSIDAPSWLAERERIEARYRAKTGLGLVCAGLALAIVVLAIAAQRRKRRMLQLRAESVAMLSHELRTPLASIRLQAETLEKRIGGLPDAGDYPLRILRDIDGLSFLVENILSFNRMERGAFEACKRVVPLGELVQQMIDDLEALRLAKVEVIQEHVEGVDVYVDAEWIKLLLLNLARNACQYNERSRAVIRISARVEERVRICFSDNGMGIPEVEWERVFQDFYRSAHASKSRGSGLGLAISRRIARMHGGDLYILSSTPRGTSFELVLPRSECDAP